MNGIVRFLKFDIYAIGLAVLGFSCTSTGEKNNCELFHSGKFRIQSKGDSIYWIIDRSDSVQVETNSKTGNKMTAKITWLTPCEYQLTEFTNSDPELNSVSPSYRKEPLLTKILSSSRDYCVFESSKKGIEMKYMDTLWVYRTRVFRRTDYINGDLFRQTNDTLSTTNEPLDIYFLKRHFRLPYYLPGQLIDETHKNKKISIWAKPDSKKDYARNWENTYTYDSLGRVINFTYSGCTLCSQLPFGYNLTYNAGGQIDHISGENGLEDSFKFFYNANGEVIRVEKYAGVKLETVIEFAKEII